MKSIILIIISIVSLSLLSSCSKSTEDEFDNANGNVVEKYITQFEVYENIYENYNYTINYDADNNISSIVRGYYDVSYFNYDESDNLNFITESYNTFNINDRGLPSN